MMVRKIVLGTRGSQLALWQTNHVRDLLQAAHPDLQTGTKILSTKGDRVLETPLPLIGGKGLFTAELEAALRSGEIDIAVHSLKDLPVDDPDGLITGAIPQRASAADVLVSRGGHTLATLPEEATIGTSSRRRAAQLLAYRSDFVMHDIRGNVDTRLKKAHDPDGVYDAIVLAHAGLNRLGLDDAITEILPFDVMLPAPGQGALGIQCRDDAQSRQLLAPLQHDETSLAVTAERAFLSALGGGCSVPIAAYAQKTSTETFQLQGRVSALDGRTQIHVETTFKAGDSQQARAAGKHLAEMALAQGANDILESLNA